MPRRIVTANDAEGRSYFVADEESDNPYLWETSGDNMLGGPPMPFLPTSAPSIDPPAGGTRCVRFAMEPWAVMKQTLAQGGFPGLDPNGFHRTQTIDYIMVLKGEVTLLLDEGETTVRAGDLVIQRNTNHAWHVRSDTAAEMWGVLVWVPET